MTSSALTVHRTGRWSRRTLSVLPVAMAGTFLLYVAARALWAAFSNDDFPESLAVKVELMPVLFPLHMVTGGLALVLVPAAYAVRRTARLHRWIGRVAAADVLTAGLTAYPVAIVAPVTAWSAAGFTVQATVWLILLAVGLDAVLRHRIARHRACMLLMAATTSGAVFFRLFLGLWAVAGDRRHFETFYACDAWMAWMLPLTGTALYLRIRPAGLRYDVDGFVDRQDRSAGEVLSRLHHLRSAWKKVKARSDRRTPLQG